MAKEVKRAEPPRQTRELPTLPAEPAKVDAATTVAAGVLSTLRLTDPAPLPAPTPVADEPIAPEPPIASVPTTSGSGSDEEATTTAAATVASPAAAVAVDQPAPATTPTDHAPKTTSTPHPVPRNQVVFLASDVVRRRLKMFTVREVDAVAASSVVAYAVEKLLDAMTDDEIARRIVALGHGLRRGRGPTTENPLYMPGVKKNQVAFLTSDVVKRRLKMFTVRDTDPVAEGIVAMFAVGRLFEAMLDDEIAAHVARAEEATADQRSVAV